MEDHLVAKIVSMCILGGISLFLGLLPIKIVEKFSLTDLDKKGSHTRTQLFLTALNSFGAGVILTTALTHMLPEVNEFLEVNEQEGTIQTRGLALGEVFLICGFLMIYVVEEVAHFILHRLKDEKSNKEEIVASTENNLTEPNTASTSVASSKTELHGEYTHQEIHSSEMFIPDDFQAAFRGFFVVLAISLHAVFEGIAMGLSKKASFIWYLCFAVAAHKFIISFCVGLQLASSKMKKMLIVIYMSTFSLITPVGIGVGIALTETASEDSNLQNAAVTVLQGLAAGTLIYVVFFEVLEKERMKHSNGLIQVTFIVLGFVIMVLVQLLEGEHDHGHGGHHHEHEHEHASICSFDPSQMNLTQSVNVTCVDGTLSVM